MRPVGERFAGLPLRFAAPSLAAAALCFYALFFSGGFDDTALVWIGGLALALAALTAAAAQIGPLPAPRVDARAAAFLGCLFGLAAWAGLSTLWSVSPDRSWAYTNRTLVYAAFALLGVLLSALVPRVGALAGAAALLLGLLIGWALLAKCVPGLYSDYGRVARLRAPVAYWNELALLCDVAVPLALWLAAPRGRRAAVRAAGALLLFGATVTLLLTYSRVGVVLACLAAAAWVVLDRDRVESLAALALGGGVGAAAFGIALALPGITKDGQPRSVRAHDGWIFALVLLAAGALVLVAALALARLERRSPLAPGPRRRVERIAVVAALALVLAGIATSVVFSGRIWSEFTNPVSSQISSTTNRFTSLNSSNRWRWWGEEWRAFTAHPAGGTGAGTFQLTDLRVHRSPLTTDEPHNTPLQFLGELGIVGLLLYAGAAAAAAAAVMRARRRAAGAERAAVTALGIGLAAFLAHTVVDMDWNFVATCGPLLLVAGALAGRPAAPEASVARVRRPLLAAGAVLFALAAFYSLAAPWLAQRQLASAASAADVKRAHAWDPLSTRVLMIWAAYEDADPLRAQQLYQQAVSLEPENSETWYALGQFYADHGAWKLAYEAFSKAWTYNRFGPTGTPCGPLDQARHKAQGIWPPSCPRGRPRAATP
ncbi:MAG TPA: O-antigen ligase family protein [Gaiellaceae bacterium]